MEMSAGKPIIVSVVFEIPFVSLKGGGTYQNLNFFAQKWLPVCDELIHYVNTQRCHSFCSKKSENIY